MFERLTEMVRNLDIPVDGDAITEAMAVRDQLDAAIAEAVGRFDSDKLWDLDGARSMKAWLRTAGCAPSDAGRLANTARMLRDLPVTLGAWRSGALTSGQVRVIVANIPPRAVAKFAADEAALVPLLAELTVNDTIEVMREWRELLDDDDDPDDGEPERELFLSGTLDGRRVLNGSFDPLGGELVETALRVAGADDYDSERTPARRRADALVDIAQFFLDHHQTRTPQRNRPHINLILDTQRDEVRCVDGRVLDPVSAGTLLCDSLVHRVVTAGSTILDYGRATRTVSTSLWNAVVLRDQHCRFGDCDVPFNRCDAHHVIWWEHGGETRVDNLALECRRHHRILHRPGWHAKLLPDGTFIVTDPKGRTRTSRPPGQHR